MNLTVQHFDTLGAAEELEAAGLTPGQAKAISLVVNRSRDSNEGMRTELKEEIVAVRTELKEEIAAVRTELKEDIAVVRTEIAALRDTFKWAGGMILVVVLANFAAIVNILLRMN